MKGDLNNMKRLLFILSVLPAVVIFLVIISKDHENKEKGFLFGIFGLGVASALVAAIVELTLSPIQLIFSYNSVIKDLVDNLLLIALPEEMAKFGAMALITWNNKRFNSTYDGIVYAVCSSLGFATIENIIYVFSDGGSLVTAIVRAVLTVPGHAMWGIIWGYGYGIAKFRSVTNSRNVKGPVINALLISIACHGMYDFFINYSFIGLGIDVVMIILSYIFVFRKVSEAARNDIEFIRFMPAFYPNYSYQTYIPFVGRQTFHTDNQYFGQNSPYLQPFSQNSCQQRNQYYQPGQNANMNQYQEQNQYYQPGQKMHQNRY